MPAGAGFTEDSDVTIVQSLVSSDSDYSLATCLPSSFATVGNVEIEFTYP